MINVFRIHQKKLLLVVTILTIIAFVWLYNPANLDQIGTNELFTVYGKEISRADVQREANKFFLARDMGQIDLISELAGMAQSEDQMVDEFIWNLYVVRHEADRLGIMPTDAQIADRIRAVPAFQTNGQFDPVKYAQFAGDKLGPRGFTEVQLEGVIRDALRVEQLRKVVSSPVGVSPGEVAEAGRLLQNVDVQTVEFPLEAVLGAIVVSEDELRSSYNQNQTSPYFVSPETRSVELVEFALPPDQAAAAGNKVEALQKVAEEAVAFSAKASSGGFDVAAKDAGKSVVKTPLFDRSGSVRGPAPEDLPGLSQIAPAAFLLSEQAPVSDPIQDGEKFFVARLTAVEPRRQMTFEEARPRLEIQLKSSKATGQIRQNADAALTAIRKDMAAGKSFSEAAAAAGLKVDTLTGVSSTGAAPDQQAIMRATLLMEPGQLSGFVPGMQGGYLVYLAARAPLDAAQLEKQKDEIAPGIEEGKQNLLFLTWLTSAREDAKIGRVTREP